jgi:hypothetical protein
MVLMLALGACRPGPSDEERPDSRASTDTPVAVATEALTPGAPPDAISTPAEVTRDPLQVSLPRFAAYEAPDLDVVPAVFHPPFAPDLSNVRVPLVLSQAQLDLLGRQGFVVSPGVEKEFFTLYEKARYNNEPIFVTSDSLLHVYHLMFDKVLRTAERERFIPLLRSLNEAMLAQTESNYRALKGTSWEDAALRSMAFVGVAGSLLDPDFPVPAEASSLVEAELDLIAAADGILPSPLFPGLEFGEDYTQYIPRGHYTLSEDLEAYFRSMMWYGRMTFRLKSKSPDVGRAETRSALLLVHALDHAQVEGQPALTAWEALYSPTVFFVGRSDDLTVVQYLQVMEAVYGPDADLEEIADDSRLDAFIELAFQLPPPKILGIVIMDTDDVEEVTKGLRLMGQRFVPDAYVFRQLIYRNVGTRDNRRGLPKGLDLFAAMGSGRAYQHLDEMGDTQYENYTAQMEKAQDWIQGVTVQEWTETLNNAWLYSFFPLLAEPGEGYPAFMGTPAWVDKQLNTVLGSWAELKHDTILYAKQVYAEMGGGPPPPPPLPPKGYVEPVPGFYARLKALTAMTREGLESRALLTMADRANLQRLEELVGAVQAMAEKELRGAPLTEEEFERIRYFGGELEHLTMAAADSETEDPFAPRFMDEEPQAAVIADVATDPAHDADGVVGPAVLEVGVGRVNPIYVVVPIVEEDGTQYLQVAKGGVFSYYEFAWPAGDRLTDEKWREMLDRDEAPSPPEWTKSFYTPSEAYADLDRAILDYHRALTLAYWEPVYWLESDDPRLEPFRPALQSLVEAKQYFGHQLVRHEIRSFDLQSENLAVVTAREVWLDTLHDYQGESPDHFEPEVARRGPYSQDVTYTLELIDDGSGPYWTVTRAIYADQPPAWQ